MTEPFQPHDKLFKTAFTHRKTVNIFIRNFVDPEIVEGIDFRTLKRETDSFVEGLQEFNADIVYSCKWKNKELRISFLYEHKSTPVAYPHFQLLRYMLNSWELDIQQKRKLRPIVPIILYHGKEKWHYKQLSDYFDLPNSVFHQYLPNFDYQLTDLSKYTDEQILKLQRSFLINTLIALKHKNEKDYFLQNPDKIFIYAERYITNSFGKKIFTELLLYLSKTSKFDKKERSILMEKLEHQTKTFAMTTYDMLINEGKQEGILIGKQEGILIGKQEGISIGKQEGIESKAIEIATKTIQKFPEWTDKEIAEFVGTTVKQIKAIRKDLEK